MIIIYIDNFALSSLFFLKIETKCQVIVILKFNP